MKLLKLSLAAFVLALSFASCKKDDVAAAPSNQAKTYTEDLTSSVLGHVVTTFNVAYDANGRLSSLISTSNAGDKFLYTYPTATTFTLDIYESNVLSIHQNYFLNSLSFVDSTLQFNNTDDTTTEKYLYNTAKQLVALKGYSYSVSTGPVLDEMHTYLYDANGNQVKDTEGSTVTTYDYSTLANNNPIQAPYMPVNPNLIQKTTKVSGGTTTTLNLTYTFDANGRLSTENGVANNGDMVVKTYTY